MPRAVHCCKPAPTRINTGRTSPHLKGYNAAGYGHASSISWAKSVDHQKASLLKVQTCTLPRQVYKAKGGEQGNATCTLLALLLLCSKGSHAAAGGTKISLTPRKAHYTASKSQPSTSRLRWDGYRVQCCLQRLQMDQRGLCQPCARGQQARLCHRSPTQKALAPVQSCPLHPFTPPPRAMSSQH